MTIDEYAIQLINDAEIPIATDSPRYRALVTTLKEVARDQRHACAEAVQAMPTTPHMGDCVWKPETHQAVMNAELS